MRKQKVAGLRRWRSRGLLYLPWELTYTAPRGPTQLFPAYQTSASMREGISKLKCYIVSPFALGYHL
jgi:hypothetical protein